MIPEYIEPLIDDAHVNTQNSEGNQPLHFACVCNMNLVDCLLEHGADIHAVNERGETALHFAAINEGIKSSELKKLVDLGVDINSQAQDGTPLEFALLENLHAVSAILSLKPDVNIVDAQTGQCAIFAACTNPQVTPEIIAQLIEAGAKVNLFDIIHKTPLHIACECAPHLINVLLQNGADPNATQDGTRPLHCAITDSVQPEHIKLLVESGALINAQMSNGATFLHLVCMMNPTLIETALELDASINAKDNEGLTPLMHACSNPSTTSEDIEFLLEQGADLQAREDGFTALHAACSDNPVLIPLLLERGAPAMLNTLWEDASPLHIACSNPSITPSQMVLVMGDNINKPTNRGTPIQLACRFSNGAVIKALLENGADITSQTDAKGFSLLNFICANPNLELTDFAPLIAMGIRFENLNHPEFRTDVLAASLVGNPGGVLWAIQHGLSVRTINEVLNTSEWFYSPDSYFVHIREAILSCFDDPLKFGLDRVETEKEMGDLLKDKAVEIFRSPKAFSDKILTIPLLLQDAELRDIFKKEICRNPDLGPELFQSMDRTLFEEGYSHEDLYTVEYFVDMGHLEKGVPLETDIPPPAVPYDLNKLETEFAEINFINPNKPGYRDPNKLKIDGEPTTVQKLRKGMHDLIIRLPKGEMDVIPESKSEQEVYYQNYKNILMHLGHLLSSLEPGPRADLLIEIAEMGILCGVRFLEAKKIYDLYFPSEAVPEEQQMLPTLERYVCQNLVSFRLGILNNWAHRLPGESIHTSNQLMHLLGEPLYLPGSKMSFEDRHAAIDLSPEELLMKFDHEYTTVAIAENTKYYLLECLRNPKMSGHVIDWFQDNTPDSYRKEHYEKVMDRVRELEEEPREVIRRSLFDEFEVYLQPDESIEEIIRSLQNASFEKERQKVSPVDWRSDYYTPIFATLLEMKAKGESFDAIKLFLKEKGIRSKVLGKDPEELKKYLEKKQITIEELPEFIVSKRRTKDYLEWLIKEEKRIKSIYDALLEEVKEKPRDQARKTLEKKGITLKKDKEIEYLVQVTRKIDYRECILPYTEKGYEINPEALTHMLTSMHIICPAGE